MSPPPQITSTNDTKSSILRFAATRATAASLGGVVGTGVGAIVGAVIGTIVVAGAKSVAL